MKSLAAQPIHPAIALCAAAALLTTGSFAQTTSINTPPSSPPCASTAPIPEFPSSSPTPPPPSCLFKPHADTSVSLGVFSQLTLTRSQDLLNNSFNVQDTAPSAGTLGTFRQTFRPWLGYSVNLGYARVSEHYRDSNSILPSGIDGFNISTNMYESSVTYLAHTRVNKRFSLFGDAGFGLLPFLPIHRGADAINYAPGQSPHLIPSVQFRPSGVFGSGIDLQLTHSFDLRAEYRGLLYKNPDFQTGDFPYSKQLTVTSEPTLSLVYHLHSRKP